VDVLVDVVGDVLVDVLVDVEVVDVLVEVLVDVEVVDVLVDVVVVVLGPVVVVAAVQGLCAQEPGPMSTPPAALQWAVVYCAHARLPWSMTQQRVSL